MKYIVAAALGALSASAAYAAPAKLKVKLDGIEHNQPIPAKFAYCQPDGKGQTVNADNISPAIRWSGAPEGTKSFAILVLDKDVPASFDNANKEGKVIEKKAKRQDFYHLALVDIPASVTSIPEGALSKGITPGGKPTGKGEYGFSGKNDYEKVAPGSNGAYDGPCPPWNDERLHNYSFTVYALKVDTLNPDKEVVFTGQQAREALTRNILAEGTVIGTYTTNAKLLK